MQAIWQKYLQLYKSCITIVKEHEKTCLVCCDIRF